MSNGKVVAVIDPLSGGHHLGYIRLITKAFLELGYKVWVFYPDAEKDVHPWLRDEGYQDSVKTYDFNTEKKPYPYLKKFSYAAETFNQWQQVGRALKDAEKNEKQKIHFVFFAWLDCFLANYLPYQLLDTIFSYSWSGLYFHPMYLLGEKSDVSSISSIDYVLKSRRCITVFLQDEFLIERLRSRIKKTVSYFPQITDQALPDKNLLLARQIRQIAGARKVVGLIGVDRRKGLLSFIELIKNAKSDRYFFFFAGPVKDPSYTPNEINHIQKFLKHLPHNCMYYPGYLNEGSEINGVIDTLDIVYQVYHQFRSASNFTTKAAYLKKPVLAKDADWIGEVTKKYSLGVTVPENDPMSIVNGLVYLDDLITQGKLESNYEGYLQKNSYSSLKESMNRLLQR